MTTRVVPSGAVLAALLLASFAATPSSALEIVPVPEWTVGTAWTYDVTGSLFPDAYTVTIGVRGVLSDHYEMGADNTLELANKVTFEGILTQDVRRSSMAILHRGEFVDLLGFLRLPGSTWEIDGQLYYNSGWTVTKSLTQDIGWAGGTSRGFTIDGESTRGQFLHIEYAQDARWITLFEVLDRHGDPVVRYEMTAAHAAFDPADLIQWERGWARYVVPIGAVPTNGVTWTSDGIGEMLLRLVTPSSLVKRAALADGDLTVYTFGHDVSAEDQDTFTLVPGVSGRMAATITVARPDPFVTTTPMFFAGQVFVDSGPI